MKIRVGVVGVIWTIGLAACGGVNHTADSPTTDNGGKAYNANSRAALLVVLSDLQKISADGNDFTAMKSECDALQVDAIKSSALPPSFLSATDKSVYSEALSDYSEAGRLCSSGLQYISATLLDESTQKINDGTDLLSTIQLGSSV